MLVTASIVLGAVVLAGLTAFVVAAGLYAGIKWATWMWGALNITFTHDRK